MSIKTTLSTLVSTNHGSSFHSPQVSAQERLRLAWAGFSPTNSPIWVMEDRKLLQKQGVDSGNHRDQRQPHCAPSLARR